SSYVPSATAHHCCAIDSDSSIMYCFGGSSNSVSLYQYSIPLGKWLAPKPSSNSPSARRDHACAVVGSTFYSLGGVSLSGDSVSDSFVQYDLKSGSSWTTVNGPNISRRGHSLISYGRTLYALFGSSSSASSPIPVGAYNIDTQSWSTFNTAYLPSIADGVSCTSWSSPYSSGGVFCNGGIASDKTGYANSLYYLDLSTATWTNLGAAPGTSSSSPSWKPTITLTDYGAVIAIRGGGAPGASPYSAGAPADTCSGSGVFYYEITPYGPLSGGTPTPTPGLVTTITSTVPGGSTLTITTTIPGIPGTGTVPGTVPGTTGTFPIPGWTTVPSSGFPSPSGMTGTVPVTGTQTVPIGTGTQTIPNGTGTGTAPGGTGTGTVPVVPSGNGGTNSNVVGIAVGTVAGVAFLGAIGALVFVYNRRKAVNAAGVGAAEAGAAGGFAGAGSETGEFLASGGGAAPGAGGGYVNELGSTAPGGAAGGSAALSGASTAAAGGAAVVGSTAYGTAAGTPAGTTAGTTATLGELPEVVGGSGELFSPGEMAAVGVGAAVAGTAAAAISSKKVYSSTTTAATTATSTGGVYPEGSHSAAPGGGPVAYSSTSPGGPQTSTYTGINEKSSSTGLPSSSTPLGATSGDADISDSVLAAGAAAVAVGATAASIAIAKKEHDKKTTATVTSLSTTYSTTTSGGPTPIEDGSTPKGDFVDVLGGSSQVTYSSITPSTAGAAKPEITSKFTEASSTFSSQSGGVSPETVGAIGAGSAAVIAENSNKETKLTATKVTTSTKVTGLTTVVTSTSETTVDSTTPIGGSLSQESGSTTPSVGELSPTDKAMIGAGAGAALVAVAVAAETTKPKESANERVKRFLLTLKQYNSGFDLRTFEAKAQLAKSDFDIEALLDAVQANKKPINSAVVSEFLTAGGLDVSESKQQDLLKDLVGPTGDSSLTFELLKETLDDVGGPSVFLGTVYAMTVEPRIRKDQVITIMKTFVTQTKKVSATSRFDLPAFVAKAKLDKPLYDASAILPLVERNPTYPYDAKAFRSDLHHSGLNVASPKVYKDYLNTLCGPTASADSPKILHIFSRTVKLVGHDQFGKTIYTVLGQSTTSTADSATVLNRFLRSVAMVSPPASNFNLEAFEAYGKQLNPRFDSKVFLERLLAASKDGLGKDQAPLTPSQGEFTPSKVAGILQATRLSPEHAAPGSESYNKLLAALTGIDSSLAPTLPTQSAEKVISLLEESLKSIGVDAFVGGLPAAQKAFAEQVDADRPPSPADSFDEPGWMTSLPRRAPTVIPPPSMTLDTPAPSKVAATTTASSTTTSTTTTVATPAKATTGTSSTTTKTTTKIVAASVPNSTNAAERAKAPERTGFFGSFFSRTPTAKESKEVVATAVQEPTPVQGPASVSDIPQTQTEAKVDPVSIGSEVPTEPSPATEIREVTVFSSDQTTAATTTADKEAEQETGLPMPSVPNLGDNKSTPSKQEAAESPSREPDAEKPTSPAEVISDTIVDSSAPKDDGLTLTTASNAAAPPEPESVKPYTVAESSTSRDIPTPNESIPAKSPETLPLAAPPVSTSISETEDAASTNMGKVDSKVSSSLLATQPPSLMEIPADSSVAAQLHEQESQPAEGAASSKLAVVAAAGTALITGITAALNTTKDKSEPNEPKGAEISYSPPVPQESSPERKRSSIKAFFTKRNSNSEPRVSTSSTGKPDSSSSAQPQVLGSEPSASSPSTPPTKARPFAALGGLFRTESKKTSQSSSKRVSQSFSSPTSPIATEGAVTPETRNPVAAGFGTAGSMNSTKVVSAVISKKSSTTKVVVTSPTPSKDSLSSAVTKLTSSAPEGWFSRFLRQCGTLASSFSLPAFAAYVASQPSSGNIESDTKGALAAGGAEVGDVQYKQILDSINPGEPEAATAALSNLSEVVKELGPDSFLAFVVPSLTTFNPANLPDDLSPKEKRAITSFASSVKHYTTPGFWSRLVSKIAEYGADFNPLVLINSLANVPMSSAAKPSTIKDKITEAGAPLTQEQFEEVCAAVCPDKPENTFKVVSAVATASRKLGPTAFITKALPALGESTSQLGLSSTPGAHEEKVDPIVEEFLKYAKAFPPGWFDRLISSIRSFNPSFTVPTFLELLAQTPDNAADQVFIDDFKACGCDISDAEFSEICVVTTGSPDKGKDLLKHIAAVVRKIGSQAFLFDVVTRTTQAEPAPAPVPITQESLRNHIAMLHKAAPEGWWSKLSKYLKELFPAYDELGFIAELSNTKDLDLTDDAITDALARNGAPVSYAQLTALKSIVNAEQPDDTGRVLNLVGSVSSHVGPEAFVSVIAPLIDDHSAVDFSDDEKLDTEELVVKKNFIANVDQIASVGWWPKLLAKIHELAPTFDTTRFITELSEATEPVTDGFVMDSLEKAGAKLTTEQFAAVKQEIVPGDNERAGDIFQMIATTSASLGPKTFITNIATDLSKPAQKKGFFASLVERVGEVASAGVSVAATSVTAAAAGVSSLLSTPSTTASKLEADEPTATAVQIDSAGPAESPAGTAESTSTESIAEITRPISVPSEATSPTGETTSEAAALPLTKSTSSSSIKTKSSATIKIAPMTKTGSGEAEAKRTSTVTSASIVPQTKTSVSVAPQTKTTATVSTKTTATVSPVTQSKTTVKVTPSTQTKTTSSISTSRQPSVGSSTSSSTAQTTKTSATISVVPGKRVSTSVSIAPSSSQRSSQGVVSPTLTSPTAVDSPASDTEANRSSVLSTLSASTTGERFLVASNVETKPAEAKPATPGTGLFTGIIRAATTAASSSASSVSGLFSSRGDSTSASQEVPYVAPKAKTPARATSTTGSETGSSDVSSSSEAKRRSFLQTLVENVEGTVAAGYGALGSFSRGKSKLSPRARPSSFSPEHSTAASKFAVAVKGYAKNNWWEQLLSLLTTKAPGFNAENFLTALASARGNVTDSVLLEALKQGGATLEETDLDQVKGIIAASPEDANLVLSAVSVSANESSPSSFLHSVLPIALKTEVIREEMELSEAVNQLNAKRPGAEFNLYRFINECQLVAPGFNVSAFLEALCATDDPITDEKLVANFKFAGTNVSVEEAKRLVSILVGDFNVTWLREWITVLQGVGVFEFLVEFSVLSEQNRPSDEQISRSSRAFISSIHDMGPSAKFDIHGFQTMCR
ncbi:hypothetical protein DFJ73DRAFT_828767, partial [Zopfochytrium polystomum]